MDYLSLNSNPYTHHLIASPQNTPVQSPSYHVAMLSPISLPSKSLDISARLRLLESALLTATNTFDRLDTIDRDVGVYQRNRIFVGPEYMFDKPTTLGSHNLYDDYGRPNTDRQLTQIDKRYIVETLKSISKKNPSILFYPGTISFKKPLHRHETADQYAKRHGCFQGTARYRQLVDKFKGKISRLQKARNTTHSFITRLKQHATTPGDDTTHIVYNTSYTLLDGQIIGRYKKCIDFQDLRLQPNYETRVFIPGEFGQGSLTVNGISHSIEICADHCAGIISNRNNMIRPGRVHIIQSDVVIEADTPEITNQCKILIHASTARELISMQGHKTRNIHGVKTFSGGYKTQVCPLFSDHEIEVYQV